MTSKDYYIANREILLKKANDRKKAKRNLDGKRIKLLEIKKNLTEFEKICTKCLEIKNKTEFTTDNCKKDKLSSQCNICKNKYFVNKRKTDILFKISSYLRSSLSESISKNKLVKKFKTKEILGCSIEKFKLYIEEKFVDGMNWGNYGKWHIDHIIPISYASTEDEIYELSHYRNFQPLWEIDNLKKGNRFIG